MSTTPGDGQPADQPPGQQSDDAAAREWWDDPGLPWKHKPTKADISCLVWMGIASVYGLILLPLRPVMLGLAPHLLGSLGYRTGLVMTGALGATGDRWWPLVLVLGSLMAMKFDWIYWWAGKLWGHGLIEVWSGRSERARKRNQRAIAFTHKYETWAIFVTYLPIPMPAAVVYAALGAAGTKLSKFLIVSFISSVISSGLYMYLGWQIGEPAVELINAYGQWLWYLSIAIIVGMIAVAWWKSRQPKSDEPVIPGPAI
ncbi:MAG: VTT domain-containing protein [Propionibacteriaceae bacterium]|uniref:Membrane protein DedA, SNARE-associated domain n=1 Tax=Micropruina glycogenica TaxID=75385 RepID=A0A2N9JMK3_9ACTN|nr:VTT domain-containing protein [Micropruina glycogenica]MCB0893187.1 VTT domain-containing protein [Propionibacteriaceae bacterium]SPD88813.1 Membrane protein DedA, SNARE-associated domain [Micropruina glycogenica]